jgi:hypothetical protein
MEQEKIERIIDGAKKYGHDVSIRDVCYGLLRSAFDNDLFCYTVVFGTPQKDNDIACYERLDKVEYLLKLFKKKLAPKVERDKRLEKLIAEKSESNNKDITFEENKSAMVELISRTEEALTEGTIDPDKGLKIIADLRVKLNDKFRVEDKSAEQYIIVEPKFNHICDKTRKECWLQTKEYAKEHWHLIDDPDYKTD